MMPSTVDAFLPKPQTIFWPPRQYQAVYELGRPRTASFFYLAMATGAVCVPPAWGEARTLRLPQTQLIKNIFPENLTLIALVPLVDLR